MVEHDTSNVFARNMLDSYYAQQFDKPWLFETDSGIAEYDSEGAACAAQRAYRVAHGFNPMTGER